MPHLPARMRALRLHAYDGAPESLRLEERPVPQPRHGEVLVQMQAAPINPSDVLFVRGQYGLRKPLPTVPGFEGSGRVVAVGGGLRARMLLGQRVACGNQTSGDGTWADYMCVAAETCFPLLRHVSTVQGATLLVNPLTAWGMVELIRQGEHRAAVQTAAASSLGQMVARLAQHYDLPMIHIVRRAEQAATLRNLGATHVLDSSSPDFDEQLRARCHELHATMMLDAVGGDLTGRVLRGMPRGAQAVVYGLLSGQPVQIGGDALVFRNQQVRGFWLSDWFAHKSLTDVLRAGFTVQALYHDLFRTPVQACLPLEDAALALRLAHERMSAGKVLFVPHLRRASG